MTYNEKGRVSVPNLRGSNRERPPLPKPLQASELFGALIDDPQNLLPILRPPKEPLACHLQQRLSLFKYERH